MKLVLPKSQNDSNFDYTTNGTLCREMSLGVCSVESPANLSTKDDNLFCFNILLAILLSPVRSSL